MKNELNNCNKKSVYSEVCVILKRNYKMLNFRRENKDIINYYYIKAKVILYLHICNSVQQNPMSNYNILGKMTTNINLFLYKCLNFFRVHKKLVTFNLRPLIKQAPFHKSVILIFCTPSYRYIIYIKHIKQL